MQKICYWWLFFFVAVGFNWSEKDSDKNSEFLAEEQESEVEGQWVKVQINCHVTHPVALYYINFLQKKEELNLLKQAPLFLEKQKDFYQ